MARGVISPSPALLEVSVRLRGLGAFRSVLPASQSGFEPWFFLLAPVAPTLDELFDGDRFPHIYGTAACGSRFPT